MGRWIWPSNLFPRPLFRLFWPFQTNITIFTSNICEKCPSSIWCWDSNPRPSQHLTTTRQGLPPIAKQSLGALQRQVLIDPPPPLVWFLASVRIFFKKDNKKVLNSTKIKFVLGSFFNPSIDRRREEKIWIAIFFSWPPSSPLYHRKSNLFVHSMEASFGIRLKSFPLKGNSNNNKNDAKYWTASGICFCAGIQCKLSGRQNTSVAIFECCHIGIRYQVIFWCRWQFKAPIKTNHLNALIPL